ncbi:hypothetical protein AB833_02710 [Chromatiales bacterium (ex Bugula neritina AB1)]|nr:hypothetical protein AB833_02710 [Chromatiales bacterium (ex Bugula neritina AB1)]
MNSVTALVLANLAVALGATVQTATGLGFAMVAAPLLALISLQLVPGPMLLINLILSLLMLGTERSSINRSELSILFPTIAAGTLIAAAILTSISTELFGVVFALLILISVVASLFTKPISLSSANLAAGGFLAGLMGTISGLSGPPMAVLYQHEDLQKTRPTLAVVFSFSYASSLIALTVTGQFDAELALDGLKLLPGLLLGYLLATKYRGLVSQTTGRVMMLSIAAFGSFILLLKWL